MHVILRHRLERELVAGNLAVADLPGAWNEGMRELLGITPPDDRLGCLQDIHWPVGAFGYFPCYTLGAHARRPALPGGAGSRCRASSTPSAGAISAPLLGWLRTRVHRQGARLAFAELVEAATGGPLAVEPYLGHLRERYLG